MTTQESAFERNEVGRNKGSTSQNLIVQPNRAELARTAAGMIAAASLISIAQRGVFNLALSGGSTPGPVYELLAADTDFDWSRCHIFWSDERCVPPDHAESNYRLVRETLLDRLPHPPALVAPMAGRVAAADCGARLRADNSRDHICRRDRPSPVRLDPPGDG